MMTKTNDEPTIDQKMIFNIKIKNDSSVSIHQCNTLANKHLSPTPTVKIVLIRSFMFTFNRGILKHLIDDVEQGDNDGAIS